MEDYFQKLYYLLQNICNISYNSGENQMKIPFYYVYVARCADGTFYTGYASNLNDREAIHNGLKKGMGAKYTRSRRPIKIIYSEKFQTKSSAMKRELEIKKLTHEEKERMIND